MGNINNVIFTVKTTFQSRRIPDRSYSIDTYKLQKKIILMHCQSLICTTVEINWTDKEKSSGEMYRGNEKFLSFSLEQSTQTHISPQKKVSEKWSQFPNIIQVRYWNDRSQTHAQYVEIELGIGKKYGIRAK